MSATKKKTSPAKRLAFYRQRAIKSGMRRVEVAVPATDVGIIRTFARAFREGGSAAERLRRQGKLMEHPVPINSGTEFLAFLRSGVEEGFDMELPARAYEPPRDSGF